MNASSRRLRARHVSSTGFGFLLCLLASPGGVAHGQATTIQLPEFGVAIDADGVVSRRAVEDPGGRLAAERAAAAQAALPGDVLRHSRLRFAFLFPEHDDIVIAGEAGGWRDDGLGRAVSLTSGQPVITLEDLCVALRTLWPGRDGPQFIGCSIDPAPEALARLREFQGTVPRAVADHERPAVVAWIHEGLERESPPGASRGRVDQA